MDDPHRILIIIPALNEEQALPGVLADLSHDVPEYDVVVVDDGSTDQTADVASASGVAVARLPFNLGTGGALRTGFRYAIRMGYQRAVQFDADGQHDPKAIHRLVAELDAGADMVIGSRFSSGGSSYEVGRVRWRAIRFLSLAVRILSGRRFSDTSSGFRGFSRPMLEHFAGAYPVEYLSDTVEALLLACYAGFRVVETPVEMRKRSGGVPSNRNFRLLFHYFRLLVAIWTTASLRRPRPTA